MGWILDLEAHRTHRQQPELQLHEALNLVVLEQGQEVLHVLGARLDLEGLGKHFRGLRARRKKPSASCKLPFARLAIKVAVGDAHIRRAFAFTGKPYGGNRAGMLFRERHKAAGMRRGCRGLLVG